MLETLKAMRRIEDTSLEADVRKLLTTKTPAWAVHAMVHYLKETEVPEAIRHLEVLLRTTAPKYPAQHQISDTCAEALGQLGNPESVATLEAAARHGVQRAIEALIIHGTVDSFDMLFKSYQSATDPGSQPNALHWLVRRSNRQVEAWMHPTTYSTDRGRAMKAKWNDWWKNHREGFVIVRSAEEAGALWDKERAKKLPPRTFRRKDDCMPLSPSLLRTWIVAGVVAFATMVVLAILSRNSRRA